ncbi:MAG: YaiO family outer membrane beta-barrel protein [Candidatus Omnitrophica bacterium]|nr:YaiO family outer membrane beta-barrel protein [Candidatus Omnitrophota bacterium]
MIQGSRIGSWKEVTNMAGIAKGKLRGYFSVSQFRRFKERDYAANFGAYLTMKDAYLHFETGFGWDRTYIYRLQDTIEYSRKLRKNLYWQLGYNFRAYPTGDNHLIYPGLVYYFGDSYIGANYAASIIQGRGTGNMATMKLNIAANKHVSWWFGGAYGQWLYDIFGLPARDELGFIIFSGFTFNISKWLSARIGYSYGTEKPKFLKRNFMYGLSLKF